MPLEPSISLQVRRPEIMSPAQAISLQNMVQQMQMGRIEQAMTLQQLARQNAITARLQQPDATDQGGTFTPQALADITRIDPNAGLKLSQLQMHIEDERQTRKFQQVQIEAAQEKLRESLRTSQKDVLNAAVSRVELTGKDASPQKKDELMRQYYQEELDRQQASGLYNYSEEQWNNLRKYPITYEEAKGRITTPKELASQRKYEERDVPLKGDMMQREYREGPTEPWKPLGAPTHKFGKQVVISSPTTASPLGPDPDFWYEYYDKTKTLPPMAWGQAGNPTREQFLKGFPEWKKRQGGTASDTAASQASFKSNAAALTSLTKDLNTFEPYKKMLDTNADIAIQLGHKIAQTNAAFINRPLNWLRQNASSNPDVAEYLAQMRFVQTEAARVINNPRIVGQLTDEGRKEMDAVINGNAPIAVVERVLNRLKTDSTNRFNAMRSQQQQIVESLKGDKAEITPLGTQSAPNVIKWEELK